jgi:hypothetical protein
MRRAIVEKEELIRRLEKRFGKTEPIFMEDIVKVWKEYSLPRIFQLIREFCEDGTLMKKIPGVYYFPEEVEYWEGVLSLDTMSIVERRYLKYGGKVFGYYSGQTLMNMVGLSNQVPNTDEIVTVNETTRVRTITINGFKVILRRAKIKINEKNAPVMQLLEIFNQYDRPLANYQRENLIALVGGKIDENILTECAKCFPKRALENFKRAGLYDVLVMTGNGSDKLPSL